MPGIFISYARETQAAVKALADDIKSLGYSTWLDHDLFGGKAWWDQILAQIRDCEIFVLALSPESVRSTACNREFGYAEDLGKPIVPIMVADSVGILPGRLSKIHFVDYRNPDRDALAGLARALRVAPPPVALPQPLPEPPAIPLSYLDRIAQQINGDAPLSGKDQSEIVSELRGGLGEAETAAGARALLVTLAKRPDLLARIGREIDALLRGTLPPGGQLPPPPERVPPTLPPPPGVDIKAFSQSARLMAGLVGAVIGGLIGLVALTIDGEPPIYATSPALAGALAGAIAQKSIRVIAFAVSGSIVGLLAVIWIVASGQSGQALPLATVIFMPPGAVIGAIAGAIIGKLRNWP